jgi:hypothetical protein
MKYAFLVLGAAWVITMNAASQAVGIGTNTPNTSSILDLGQGGKPLVIPKLSTDQMNAVARNLANTGMVVFNTVEQQFYGLARYRSNALVGQSNYRWQPISTGPQMIAWGVVDSFATEKNGSGNYNVTWDATNTWYTLTITSQPFFKDSMLLVVTPVGNGSWDQNVSIGELIESETVRRATIKFTDVSRQIAGYSSTDSRRRSWFYFVLYNLRKDPYNILNP